VYICRRLVGCQAAIAGRPAPTVDRVHLKETGRLSGRHRWQARSHRGPSTPERDWSAVRPPSLADQLPQWTGYTRKRLVSFQAAIAGRPGPTGDRVHLKETGRLAGRHRGQASSHRGPSTPERDWSAVRPPSSEHRPEQAHSHSKNRGAPPAFNHSIGRAVARLLLILIHLPLRQAEWRRSSGGQARSAVRRSRTHREEVVAKQTGGDAPR
jgi:hypothetical protein